MFLSSLFLLAILTRIAAAGPPPAILRGEFAPALLSVLVTTGLTIGLLMMVYGGSGYFGSPTIELVSIFAFAVASVWIIAKFVGRAPHASPV